MTFHIGFLIFPDVQQLDLTGPYDVFGSLPDARLYLLAPNLAPVKSATGMTLTPDTLFSDCPALDVLCVPGGKGVNVLLEDASTLAFVRKQAARARYVTSVCTGALVLGAAGLLKGKRATTHWASQAFLPKLGAIAENARVVRDGNIITGGGVTAGIDFALTVVAELCGVEQAQLIQLGIEYAPAPPFDAGHPNSAPAHILALADMAQRASVQERERIIARVSLLTGK